MLVFQLNSGSDIYKIEKEDDRFNLSWKKDNKSGHQYFNNAYDARVKLEKLNNECDFFQD